MSGELVGDGDLHRQARVSADESGQRVQDLQSLASHEEAVRMVRAQPALLDRASTTLERWIETGKAGVGGPVVLDAPTTAERVPGALQK